MNRRGILYGAIAGIALGIRPSRPAHAAEFNVYTFGAKGNGAADDTGAFMGALAQISAQGGGILKVPVGTYRITQPLPLTQHGLVVQGEGKFTSRIFMDTPTEHGLSVTADRVKITDINLWTNRLQTSGSAVHLASGGSTIVRDVVIEGTFWDGVKVTDANGYRLMESQFWGMRHAAVQQDAMINSDAGDSIIANCQMLTLTNTPFGIRFTGGSGLQVLGGKINGYATSIAGDIASNGWNAGLQIQNVNIENWSQSGISLKRQTGSGIWYWTQIQGNHLVSANSGPGIVLGAGFERNIVQGNQICVGQSNIAIDVQPGAAETFLDGNYISWSGTAARISNGTGSIVGSNACFHCLQQYAYVA